MIFLSPKPVIGMIHVAALPGTPAGRLQVAEIAARAVEEARIYRSCGIDGLMIENMHDVPYLRSRVGPEIVAAMAVIGREVKQASGLPVGIQILAGANIEALGAACAAGLDFVRVEGYVFAHVADEGLIESSAAELLRYRRMIGADHIQIWADIKKKHSSHAITSDITLGATAEAAEFMRGDAVIVTGSVTGAPVDFGDLAEVRKSCRLPIIIGSGVTAENLPDFFDLADGFIVGSSIKREGKWSNPPDEGRIRTLLEVASKLKGPSGAGPSGS